MTKYIDVSGKTEEEAVSTGLARLGLTRDDVSVEILEMAKRTGFLNLRSTPAVVRLRYEVPDEPSPAPAAPTPVPAPAPAPAAPKGSIPVSKPQPAAPKKEKPAAQPRPAAAVTAPAADAQAAAAEGRASAAGTQQERAERYLRGLLDLMGVQADITVRERDGGGLNVELSGSGMGAVIGRRGETLDAIQHLVNYSVNRGSEKRMHISVDAENYRSKREDSLVRLAEKMAAKAVKYKRSMALEPMNSYERHVIHTALQNYQGVSTASVGVEPNRRVVVNYERGDAPASGKPKSREWA